MKELSHTRNENNDNNNNKGKETNDYTLSKYFVQKISTPCLYMLSWHSPGKVIAFVWPNHGMNGTWLHGLCGVPNNAFTVCMSTSTFSQPMSFSWLQELHPP